MAHKYARARLDRFLKLFPDYPLEILLTCLYDLPTGWYDTKRCAEMQLRWQFPEIDLNPRSRTVTLARNKGRALLRDHMPVPSGNLQVNTRMEKLLLLRNGRVINITKSVERGTVREPRLGCALGETCSRETQWLGDHHSNILVSAKTGKQIVL